MSDPQFNLKIASRESVIFSGAVSAITSYNEKGKFDVLASHANFISLIKDGVLIREKGDINSGKFNQVPVKEIKFDSALMRVKENNVEIYIGVQGNKAI